MRGYVYRMTDGTKFYIGSTGLTPAERLLEHKTYSKKAVSQRQPVYRYFASIGWENVTIETLRECEYSVKRELLQHEREEYDRVCDDPNCLNKHKPWVSREESKQRTNKTTRLWQSENKDHCRDLLKEWRKNNPEKVKEQRDRRSDKAKEEQRQWYQREGNTEKKREQVRQWRLDNPEKYAEQKKRSIEKINEKRRAAKNNIEGKIN